MWSAGGGVTARNERLAHSTHRLAVLACRRARGVFRPPPSSDHHTHRNMIIAVILSFAGICGLQVHIESSDAWWPLALYAALLILLAGSCLHAVKAIERAEAYGRLFDEAFAFATPDLPTDSEDKLGPATRRAVRLGQEGERSLDKYVVGGTDTGAGNAISRHRRTRAGAHRHVL